MQSFIHIALFIFRQYLFNLAHFFLLLVNSLSPGLLLQIFYGESWTICPQPPHFIPTSGQPKRLNLISLGSAPA
jgi:hypothetical protein